jgi:hypothetical protein
MSFIEFQISAAAFLAAQLTTLQSQKICSPTPVTVGPYQIVVDHVEFGANAIRHNVPTRRSVYFEQAVYGQEYEEVDAFQTQLAQEVTIYLTDLNDVLAHPNQPPGLIVPVPATIVVNLDYYQPLEEEDCFFFSSFNHVDPGPMPRLPPGIDPNFVTQQLNQLAQTLVPKTVTPFNLAQSILRTNAHVENAGMSVDEGLSRIAFRTEIGSSNPYSWVGWQAFYQGNVPDRLQGRDWAVFIDGQLFGSMIAAPVDEKVSKSSKFHLVTGVAGYYSVSAPDRAHVQIPFGGNVDTAICTAYVDVTLDAEITVSKANTLSVDMNMSHDVHGTACTVTAGVLGAVIGGLVDLVMPGAVIIINPVTGFLAAAAAAEYVENSYVPNIPVRQCQKLSDTHYTCTQTIPLKGSAQFGTLSFTSLAAQSDGVAVGGTLRPRTMTSAAVAPRFTPFAWHPPAVSCSSAGPDTIAFFLANPQQLSFLLARVVFDNTGEAPLFLCSFAVQHDPLNVFQNAQIQVINPTGPIELRIAVGLPSDQYYQNPYSFDLLVFTNGGVRLVSIPPPPQLTQQMIDRLEAAMVVAVGNCEQLVDPWFLHFRGYNPKWSVDPPANFRGEHIWEVTVTGLSLGETASLADQTGRTLATARSVTGIPSVLSAVAAPNIQIGVVRGAAAGPMMIESAAGAADAAGIADAHTQGHRRRGIAVRQQLLIERAVISLPEACERFGTAQMGATPIMFAVFQDWLAGWDLSQPDTPRPFGSWNVPGLRGALQWRGGLLAFGADGFATIDAHGRFGAADRCCRERPVFDALAAIGTLIAAGRDSLDVYSPSLSLAASVPTNAHRLARIGTTLAAAGPGALHFFDIADPMSPKRLHGRLAIEATDLGVPPDSGGHMLAAVTGSHAELIRLPPRGAPEIIGSFAQPPWYLYSARLPGLLATLNRERTAIRIGGLGESVTL